MNDFDYNDLASRLIPIVVMSGRYKIDNKYLDKDAVVCKTSSLLTVTINKTAESTTQ